MVSTQVFQVWKLWGRFVPLNWACSTCFEHVHPKFWACAAWLSQAQTMIAHKPCICTHSTLLERSNFPSVPPSLSLHQCVSAHSEDFLQITKLLIFVTIERVRGTWFELVCRVTFANTDLTIWTEDYDLSKQTFNLLSLYSTLKCAQPSLCWSTPPCACKSSVCAQTFLVLWVGRVLFGGQENTSLCCSG